MAKNTKRVAIYAGTFDPITKGHIDIIERALTVFDSVIVAVSLDCRKECLFSVNQRKKLAMDALRGKQVRVDTFDGLLVDYAKKVKGSVVVRGLRAVSDFEKEFEMALMNRMLAEDIETVFIMTNKEYSFIRSSIVKEVAQLKGDVSHLVPLNVNKALKEKFK